MTNNTSFMGSIGSLLLGKGLTPFELTLVSSNLEFGTWVTQPPQQFTIGNEVNFNAVGSAPSNAIVGSVVYQANDPAQTQFTMNFNVAETGSMDYANFGCSDNDFFTTAQTPPDNMSASGCFAGIVQITDK